MNAGKPANDTKGKARQLQNTLYLAAKANPKRRFHALYDKVIRADILWEAWKRVRSNQGSGGIDGITIDFIKRNYGEERFVGEIGEQLVEGTYQPQAVRRHEIPKADGKMRPLGIPTVRDRVVQMAVKMIIEPIFEADFKDCSYGFRPKRDAKGAIRSIQQTIRQQKITWVVDIDISGYFDNIPHDKLMMLVEQRISDRRILKLIRKWLKVGFVKDNQLHETDIGSPQGGVISPLLANIYLNYLDSIWEKKFTHLGSLVRYADDLVILCRTKTQAVESISVLKAVFSRLELQMNTTKSKLINISTDQEGFDFLGMHHKNISVKGKYGRYYSLRSYPSQKAMRKMRDKIKTETAPRNRLYWTMQNMVAKLNPIILGWKNYYRLDPFSGNILKKIDAYIRMRLTLFWNKKHRKRNKHGEMWLVAQIAKKSGLRKVSYGSCCMRKKEEHRKAV